MYVTNGVIKVKLAENTLEIHEGEGLFINSNVVHEIRDANEGARLYCRTLGCPMSRNISILLMLVELLIKHSPFHLLN